MSWFYHFRRLNKMSIFLSAYYYTISTKTGAVYGGGTDGKVFVRLTGDRGSTDKVPLTSNLPSGVRHFKAGQ